MSGGLLRLAVTGANETPRAPTLWHAEIIASDRQPRPLIERDVRSDAARFSKPG
jgi:hypothetical protein